MQGAIYQYANDMSMGAVDQLAYSMSVCMDCNASDAYRSGQQAGRVASTTVATVDQVTGAIVAGAGAAAIPATLGGGAACAGVTAGACALPAGAVLGIEAGMVVGGTLQAGYGAGVISYSKNNPVSGKGRPGNNQAQNKQFDGAVRQLEKEFERKLSKDEIRQLHEALHDLENPGFKDIVDEGHNLFDQ